MHNLFPMRKHVQVVVKYNKTNHVETLNWHNKDTGARVVVSINSGARPAPPPRVGPGGGAPRPDGSPVRSAAAASAAAAAVAAAAAAQPSSGAPDGNPVDPMSAAAHAARMQQQALPYGLAPRVNLLSNMNFNWQV